jgi:carboxymethylenebutenolidase
MSEQEQNSAAPLSGDICFDSAGDPIGGYLAVAAGDAPAPGLVLIPDVRGIYEHFRDVARRFAGCGFTTLALDLYAREGAPDLPDLESAIKWMAELPDGRVLGDIAAAVEFLSGHDSVGGRPVGITGFCMGGQYTLMAACSVPGLSAAVSWYGMLRYAETPAHKPQSPLDMAPRMACPWLGMFGENDPLIPGRDVAELRSLLESAGRDFEIVQYPDAGHAFFNDSRPEMYRPEAARDAWPRAVGFLRERLAD